MASLSEQRRVDRRFQGRMLPWWSARLLALLLGAGAVGLPWLATWQRALEVEEVEAPSGKSRVEVQLRPELVELPGGTFLMGSPPGEVGRDNDENRHSATVTGFAICRTEVTLGQWQAVMGTRPNDCDDGCADEHPVQKVSCEDAVRYLNRLTDRENEGRGASEKPVLTRCYDEVTWSLQGRCTGYRLPTEAEWEYAARGGTEMAYSFGAEFKEGCLYANGADQSAKQKHPGRAVNEACDDGFAELAPVGHFKPNPWGLYDVHGNVWEWVWDRVGPYPESSPADYAGPDDGLRRVLRGGSFNSGPGGLRSSDRGRSGPTVTDVDFGFRCARCARPSP